MPARSPLDFHGRLADVLAYATPAPSGPGVRLYALQLTEAEILMGMKMPVLVRVVGENKVLYTDDEGRAIFETLAACDGGKRWKTGSR